MRIALIRSLCIAILTTRSNAIREKSEWWIKSKDAAIAGKWAKETLQAQEASPESERLTQKMVRPLFSL